MSGITGLFYEFVIFTIIIFVHEMGHVTAGLLFKINIKKILILPFGGLTIFEMPINIRLYKEFLIAVMGPLFQIIFWLFLYKINYCNSIFNYYNTFILLFNLLPISPLDGSKKSYFITFYTSIITIILFIYVIIFKNYNLSLIIIVLFLIKELIKGYINFNFIFNKFLLERYKNDFHFSKRRVIKNINSMKRDYSHIIKEGNKYATEKEILRKRFDNVSK